MRAHVKREFLVSFGTPQRYATPFAILDSENPVKHCADPYSKHVRCELCYLGKSPNSHARFQRECHGSFGALGWMERVSLSTRSGSKRTPTMCRVQGLPQEKLDRVWRLKNYSEPMNLAHRSCSERKNRQHLSQQYRPRSL